MQYMKKRPSLIPGQLRPKALRTKAGVVVEFCRGINGTDPIVRDGKPQVAFVGRSNVGKSSTINAILGTIIARASARPGKTTEINFFSVTKDGDPATLGTSSRRGGYVVDLPGYGYARMGGVAHEKIRKHVLWYLSSGEAMPKMLVLVLDARVGGTEHDKELVEIARDMGHPFVMLANKMDKFSARERGPALAVIQNAFPDAEIVPFSAEKKENIEIVRDAVFRVLGITG